MWIFIFDGIKILTPEDSVMKSSKKNLKKDVPLRDIATAWELNNWEMKKIVGWAGKCFCIDFIYLRMNPIRNIDTTHKQIFTGIPQAFSPHGSFRRRYTSKLAK